MLSSTISSRNRFLLGVALCGLIGLSSGCGGTKLTPVSGRVTVDGKALTTGTVRFIPDKAKGNTFGGEPIGEINAQGEYTLQTRGKPGAPLGSYKVAVSANESIGTDNTSAKPGSLVNPTYSLAETTPLEIQVVAQPGAGAYDLKLGP
jgi:hypothetical protein